MSGSRATAIATNVHRAGERQKPGWTEPSPGWGSGVTAVVTTRDELQSAADSCGPTLGGHYRPITLKATSKEGSWVAAWPYAHGRSVGGSSEGYFAYGKVNLIVNSQMVEAPGFAPDDHLLGQRLTAKHVVSIPSIPSKGYEQVQNRYSDSFGGGVRSSSPSYMPLNDLQASVAGAAFTPDMPCLHDDVYSRAVAQSHGLACNDGAISFLPSLLKKSPDVVARRQPQASRRRRAGRKKRIRR
jgi:hypothetical protein